MRGDSVRLDGSRMGYRKIRAGGRVRWEGKWFRLDDSPANVSPEEFASLSWQERSGTAALSGGRRYKPKYDGRMDGRVGLFYNYGRYHEASRDHVYLHSVDFEWPGPTCVAGYFVWDTFILEHPIVPPERRTHDSSGKDPESVGGNSWAT